MPISSTAEVRGPRKLFALILLIAALAGFCTMSYEVLWFRVLKYFVDNSIQSFAIMLTTFLTGLTAGGFVVSKVIDSRKDRFLFLGFMEISIGFLCLCSIPVISGTDNVITELNKLFGTAWSGEIAIRFMAFSLSMLLPTALMGGAFPVFSRIYSDKATTAGKSIGEVYGINTAGGVLGSLSAGFVFVPLWGIQNSITAVSMTNMVIGLLCVGWGSALTRTPKLVLNGCVIFLMAVLALALPRNAFMNVYSSRYPPPRNEMIYCKENINGTTTVFQDARQNRQRYLLIDGTGEVSTDYFSMRAFRFLGLLPALYSPDAKNALVVTFGSGIVAGSTAALPGIGHVDCVEICKEAFNAANYFAFENHDALHNKKISLLVNDGRNFVFTTTNRYDIISADATHPTSGDSWVLYTREFYNLCKSKLTDGGIMCQWTPLHGILERDYRIILNTFCSVFPFAAVYYSGGYKTMGHTVLLGSKNPMRIDVGKAEKLFEDRVTKEDLERVNVFSAYDFFSCFIMDQEGIREFAGGEPVNTDDRPAILFSKFKLDEKPYMGISSLARYRKNIFPQLCGMEEHAGARIQQTVENNFKATGSSLEGQILEFEEYTMRMKQDFEVPKAAIAENLDKSKILFEQAILDYRKAISLNPDDRHTLYLLSRASGELDYLNSFLEKMNMP
jgi:spermidine synthase